MTESKTVLTYTNRLGYVYYFRKTGGGRGGEQIVASRKRSEDALDLPPRGMEIAETPNGKVSCRKKMKSVILPAEIRKVKAWIPTLKKQARVVVELKPNAIVVHSAPVPKLPITLTDVVLKQILKELSPEQRAEARRSLAERDAALEEKMLHYEPVVKFELHDPATRQFAAYRMCYLDVRGEWTLLSVGTLDELAAKILPHLEKESFFDLM